jgi:putative flippase GtrA
MIKKKKMIDFGKYTLIAEAVGIIAFAFIIRYLMVKYVFKKRNVNNG